MPVQHIRPACVHGHADALGARYVAILGEQELARGEVTLRDMRDSQQRTVAGEAIEEELTRE